MKSIRCLQLFSFLFFLGLSPSVTKCQQSQWSNLVGVTGVADRIAIHLNLEGAEEFNVNANDLKQICLDRMNKEQLLIKGDAPVPTADIFVSGAPTGGGGGNWTVELTLTARVLSPYAKDHKISAIIWKSERSDQQLMSYDPDKKKVQHPTGALSSRIQASLREVLELLIQDLHKANSKE